MSRWSVDRLEARLDGFHLGPIDLTLSPGRSLILLGHSGAGKTSLLRAIAGFLPARAGRVLRAGVDITELPPEHRGLGYVPQGLGLLPHRTVAANVRYPLELRDRPGAADRTRTLLERFHLTELAARRPGQLSGGEQQRVAIARALAADPELILWDEPWHALDVTARHELSSVWEELRAQDEVPVVVVTHDPALAFSIGDAFVQLDGGRVRRRSDAAGLLTRPNDAFTARFIGLENVYDEGALRSSTPGPLAGWLSSRAGPGGIAFAAPVWEPRSTSAGTWEGKVLQVRPDPHGIAIELLSEGFILHLRMPSPVTAAPPVLGERIRFDLEGTVVHALEGAGASV